MAIAEKKTTIEKNSLKKILLKRKKKRKRKWMRKVM